MAKKPDHPITARVVAEAKRLGLSEGGLCTKAGLPRNLIAQSRIDGTPIGTDSLVQIAAVLGRTVAWLQKAAAETPADIAHLEGAKVEVVAAGGGTPEEPQRTVTYRNADGTSATVLHGTDGAMPDADRMLVPLGLLVGSDLNPRKSFDELGDIQELADSILENGILQNLVVREFKPGAPGFGYVIVAGGRRYRALQQLANVGKWDPKSANVPVKVITADDANHLALALLENLQRKDMNPLEEAEAFQQLQAIDPKKWTTAAIAKKIGFSQRHVQLRMRLVTDLIPEAQAALRDGKIRTEVARVLVMTEAKQQGNLLKQATDEHYPLDAHQLRDKISYKWTPVTRAIFPFEGEGALDAGPVYTDEVSGERWFTDSAKFKAAQKSFAMKRGAELQKESGLGFVKHVEHFYDFEWAKDKKNPKAGVLVVIDYRDDVRYKVGYRQKTPAERAGPSGGGHSSRETAAQKAERLDREKRRAAYQRLEKSLADAIAGDSGVALRMLLLTAFADYQNAPALGGELLMDAGRRSKHLNPPAKIAAVLKGGEVNGKKGSAEVWKAFKSLTDTQALAMLAELVADFVSLENDYGDDNLETAIIDSLGVEIPEACQPQQTDIETAAKPGKKKAAE